MQIESDTQLAQFGEWTLRFRPSAQPGSNRLILLVHGLTGDEKVMWVFARRLPRDSWVLAPRGRVKSPQGGYGWFQSDLGITTGVEEYLPSADALAQLVRDWPRSMGFQPDQTGLIGFSQGAALTYTFALTHPELVDSIAGLAGFVPPGAERYAANRPLQGKRVFIAHGLRDETVPVAKALQAVELMQAAGATVTYCESDVGHKLGADCLRGLESFFAK